MSLSKNILQERYQKLASKLGYSVDLPKYNSKKCGGEDHTPIWISTVTLYDGKTYEGEKCNTRKKAETSSAQVALMSSPLKKEEFKTSSFITSPIQRAGNKSSTPSLNKTKTKVISNNTILLGGKDSFQRNIVSSFGINGKVTQPKGANIVLLNTDNRYLVLIDSENQPSAIGYFIKNYKKDDVDLISFLSVGHNLKYKIRTDILKKRVKGEDSRIKVVEIPSTRKNSADVGLIIYLIHFLLTQKNQYKNIILVSSDKFIAALSEIINNSSKMGIKLGSNECMIPARTMIECVNILTEIKLK